MSTAMAMTRKRRQTWAQSSILPATGADDSALEKVAARDMGRARTVVPEHFSPTTQ
eukprot:NODE_20146_length_811_cov_1.935673.p8 GENE.NODE_20146_length_811_cov_1.935673~~NODE_20146_length_811_cov_1.935673.p8  ORF type:complete len:56 (+),score=13.32 NODE_20146_length_811_cov_1.935673:338-505(+)